MSRMKAEVLQRPLEGQKCIGTVGENMAGVISLINGVCTRCTGRQVGLH